MLKNYLIISIRNLRKHSVFSLINVLGLALGIGIFVFIDQFLQFEYSYDQFHENSGSIFRVCTKRYLRGEVIGENATAMPPLKPVIEDNIPQVSDVVRVYDDGLFVVENPEATDKLVFEEDRAYYADPDFFSVFGFEILAGNPVNALEDVRQVALSESAAIRYFGKTDVIGETLKATNQREVTYTVSAVFADAQANSHFKPELVFSFITYLDVVHPDWPVRTNWIWNDFYTYFRINDSDPAQIEQRINDLAQQTWGHLYEEREVNFDFYLQPIEQIHYTSNIFHEFEKNIDGEILNWLRVISILILVVAWINYINLSTARSIERAREVGVRKTIGASRFHLSIQFIIEAALVNLMAVVAASIMLVLSHDAIAEWLELIYSFEFGPGILIPLGVVLLGGLLSAVYPALVLSSFSPSIVLKGKFRNSPKGLMVRKTLVYLQFVITPLLVGGTYLIYTQTNHMLNRDLGVDIDQVLVIKAPKVEYADMTNRYEYFVEQSTQSGQVQHTSSMMLLPGDDIGWYSWFQLQGDTIAAQYMNINLVEYDFEQVVDLELVSGRTLDPAFADSSSLVINEAAARMWGYSPEEIIGKTFRWSYSPTIPYFDRRVVGVVSNHVQEAFAAEEVPMIFALRRYTPARFAFNYYLTKLSVQGENSTVLIQAELDRLQSLWLELFPNDPFNYSFLDEEFNQKFINEIQFTRVVNAFAVISLIIAGLGLFGLSSFSILQRTKEIGIRKVLGASANRISRMILSEYLVLIAVAYIISVPVLYFVADSWLANYASRVALDILFFVLPLIVSMIIGLLSVIFQTTKATSQNPVKSLRYE